ncbi:alpha-(1,3)-fucosyltransferase C-like isoform X2 [Ruditapes philippinarum]|uniref:alpha-(1,3)-fucosyltransferase C-like isoform X2 n=1 Tax=Ruditapes philippinarum TaxID=129788 RepID=UPI00295AAC74|nr:alpha-(1,3)-fucosyltransferase C-like isoform X2 [Ruditapes philippinarum]
MIRKMFSTVLRKTKHLVHYTVTFGLIVVVLVCVKNNYLPFIRGGNIYRGPDHRILVSKSVTSRNITSQVFSHSIKEYATFKNTKLKTHVQKTGITMVYKKSSPFIDPVFHVDISSHKPTRNHVDHTILFLESPDWFKQWSASANIGQCLKYTNCKQSFDRSLFRTSKAVVFNLPERGIDSVPPIHFKSPDQVWVFFTLESPLHINQVYNSRNWHNVFNWSWTYHPNADIFNPYGVLVEKKIVPFRNYSSIFRKKTKFAAWVVSNCHAPSERDEFVNILKRFIDVDVFGNCGSRAPQNLSNYLNEHYKFYLGFENSLCENYMTEKFFKYYKLDVITVLRGHTNYTEYLPDISYINTSNFSSIAALAQFMKDLCGNEEQYVSYLKEKDKYTVYEREFMFKDALCRLCEKLNNIEENRRTYGDMYKWLGPCYGANDLITNATSSFDVAG